MDKTKLDVENMTLAQLRDRLAEADEIRKALNMPLSPLLSSEEQPDDSHWQIGQNYFIRTVTYHLLGRLVKVTDKELVLVDASWVASSGRFSEALVTGQVSENEPFPDNEPVIIGRGSITDAVRWTKSLLRVVL
jgi:hypothetical protein